LFKTLKDNYYIHVLEVYTKSWTHCIFSSPKEEI